VWKQWKATSDFERELMFLAVKGAAEVACGLEPSKAGQVGMRI
jgi:hypothetical protein